MAPLLARRVEFARRADGARYVVNIAVSRTKDDPREATGSNKNNATPYYRGG